MTYQRSDEDPFLARDDISFVLSPDEAALAKTILNRLVGAAAEGPAPHTGMGRQTAVELARSVHLARRKRAEHFGPVLHVARYDAADLEKVVAAINGTGYGLTLGVHSRNEETAERIERLARVGNLYVNRNQIGAVVGVQPFGGCGLSGTGPKAGGPSYLLRFANERTTSTNTTAVGGNASLLSLGDD